MDDAKKNDNLPPGFRFHPTDEELITYYLKNKISDSNFTAKAIADIDLNRCEPWDIPGKAKMGEKEWYFFNLRDRKYPTGVRTNRATNAGYWKTTGKDKEIFNSNTSDLVGMKKTLVFYKGRAPRGEKTNWVIHEYRVHAKSTFKNSKDEWVVCRAFKKSSGVKKYTNPNTSTQARSTTFNNINPYTNQALHHDHLLHSTLLPPLHHPDPYYGSTSSRSYMAATDLAELTRLLTSNTTTRGGNQQAMMVNTMAQQVQQQQQQNQANFTVSGLNLNLGVHPQHGQVVGRPMHGSAGFGVLGGEVGLGGEPSFVGVHDQVNNQAHAGGNRFNNNANMEACVELDGYWGAGNY